TDAQRRRRPLRAHEIPDQQPEAGAVDEFNCSKMQHHVPRTRDQRVERLLERRALIAHGQPTSTGDDRRIADETVIERKLHTTSLWDRLKRERPYFTGRRAFNSSSQFWTMTMRSGPRSSCNVIIGFSTSNCWPSRETS